MFDLASLETAIKSHGRVARVVIATHDGSAPRETGTSMLIWRDGQSGTIGGGALEWEAAQKARALLATGRPRLDRIPLGPALGQCCGGAVTLVTEIWDKDCLPDAKGGVIARSIDGRPMPLAVKRLLDRARAQGVQPRPQLVQGWLIEPVEPTQRPVWIWGAGHVGRAIVQTLAPLPTLSLTWVDVAADRFPPVIPEGVTPIAARDPGEWVHLAPKSGEHLILTYSHALDLDLCHRLLTHGFARCGVIGSATKWARFRSRLAALGHAPQTIARIDCPIGDPALGKHPQAIAIGVAADVLRHANQLASRQENAG